MDILDEEAEEDIYRMAGTGAIERPMTAPILRRVRVRLPWLVVTLGGTLATVIVLKGFSATLEQKIAFALFIPVMAAMCGNIAMQSTAMLIRGFATGEVELSQTLRIMLGEMLVGFSLGTLCGMLGGALAALMFGDYVLGVIVAVSMDLGMILAIVVGTATPIILVRFNIDPAIASGPFVTTLNDITGLTTYVATASLMLHWFPAT
jgi:magnesium transporter